jgi:ABC-type multidrug transport system fused ATPase/permease subunit
LKNEPKETHDTMHPPREDKRKVGLDSVWRESRELIWEHRKSLALGLALMLVNRLAGLVLPGSSKWLIDVVIGEDRWDLLVYLAAAAGAATLVQAATGFALSQVVSVAAQRAIADMRRKVQAHILQLPVSYFDSTKSGVLISRIMTDAEGIRNLVGTGLIQLTGGILTASIALVVLFWLNWSLTLVMIVLLLAFAGSMAVAFRKLRPIFRERGAINAQVTGRLGEGLGGIRILKTYVAEKREERVFSGGVYRLLRNVATTITGTSAISAVSTVIVGAIGVVIIIVGGNAIQAGTMTLGDLVLYTLFVGLMTAPLVQIAGIGTQITEAFAGLDRIREIRELDTERTEDAARMHVEDIHGEIVFDGVTFEYDPGVPVLKNITFEAPAGTTTALVGPSGAGKSTLIGLVMAFHHPKQGLVRVDGHDLQSLRLRDYRRHLGVVLQENFLFDGSVRENIAFARPQASEEEVREAARIAHCDEFIERFEAGYDTIVGERGVKLSGGQRQRIAIARAILADPRILILDEATSSLDSESEALIRDGLRSLRRGRTTFVIAHRLSTIRSADRILVLEHGEIVERGTHEELLRSGGLYRRLYDKQYGTGRDDFVNPGEAVPPSAADDWVARSS